MISRHSGYVHVSELQYYLHDADQSPYPPYGEDTGLATLGRGGGITISCGTNTGNIHCTVELYDDEPPLSMAEWDEIVDVDYRTEVGDTRLHTFGGRPAEGFPVLSHTGPGDYRIRFRARNRDDPANKNPYTSVEEHHISVWPGSVGHLLVHKATDEFGERMRGSSG
ncbi:hypothetical protein [Plantactinospora sp. B5E13]|uniref:hypothetical protein n=1 Tax=unclassified Plantactinospora TaxID=2631981 RepID=UPI00325F0522